MTLTRCEVQALLAKKAISATSTRWKDISDAEIWDFIWGKNNYVSFAFYADGRISVAGGHTYLHEETETTTLDPIDEEGATVLLEEFAKAYSLKFPFGIQDIHTLTIY